MANLYRNYRWVPSLYFMQGLPFALVTAVSSILYKNFGISNTKIAFYTSLFVIPWFIKPLLAPLLETFAMKRTLTLLTQLIIAILILLLAYSLSFTHFFLLSGCLFFTIALASTIHDINSDGLYIISLNKHAQAYFIGMRTMFYQIAKLITQGGLVFTAGLLVTHFSPRHSWQIALTLFACLPLILAIYHKKVLPVVEKKPDYANLNLANTVNSFKAVFRELAKLPHLITVVNFILIYNLAEMQLTKILPLFLLDKFANGGLALSIANVGFLYGGIGILGMLLGVTSFSFLLAKSELKHYLVPLTAFVGLTNFGYLLLSAHVFSNLWAIGSFIALAQFSFGLSNGAYMLYLLNTFAQGPYSMSLYAIGTALMGAGMALGGAISGYIQYLLGYTGFFIWIIVANFLITIITAYTIKCAQNK